MPVITSHVQETGNRWPFLISLVGHLGLFFLFVLGAELLPRDEPLLMGTGLGGGQGGDFVTVGLAADPGGGSGMYKPALTPAPAAAPEPPKAVEKAAGPAHPKGEAFQEKAPRRSRPSSAKASSPPEPAPAGAIPRPPDPGTGGPGGQSAGSGGGFGGGQGVTIGSGTGEGVFDSWYARQVEQRIGQNWLKTSLGNLGRPVQTVVSFEIRANGRIDAIRIEKFSGLNSVDLAAQRAVLASSPLPPLPYEFRHRTVKFIAYFEYPPR